MQHTFTSGLAKVASAALMPLSVRSYWQAFDLFEEK